MQKSVPSVLLSLRDNVHTLFGAGYRFSTKNSDESALHIEIETRPESEKKNPLLNQTQQDLTELVTTHASAPTIENQANPWSVRGNSMFISLTQSDLKTITEAYEKVTGEIGCRMS